MFDAGTAGIRAAVRVFASEFDPDRLDVDGAKWLVREWAAIEHTAATLKALAAARVATAGRWDRADGKSAADWLAGATGTTGSRAREQIETGRRLGDLEETAGAAKRGELSPEQAAAITDAASADTSAEASLLGTAKHGSLRDLRDRCASTKARADADPEATRRRIHANRKLREWTDREGVAHLHAEGPVDAIARVKVALAPIADWLFNQARAEGRHEDPAAYLFDALIALADDATSNTTSAATAPTDDAGSAAPTDDDAGAADGAPTDDAGAADAPLTAHAAGAAPSYYAADGAPPVDAADGAPPDGRHDARDVATGNEASLFDEPADGTDGDEPDRDAPEAPEDESAAVDEHEPTAVDGADPVEGQLDSSRSASRVSARVPVRRPGPVPLRFRAVIRVDYEALVRGWIEGEETCEIAGLGPIPVQAARDLLGEATMHLVITRGVDVANVTYLGRSANAAQRIALLWQMPMCIVEGCARRAHLEYDHNRPFADCQETRLDNVDPKCGQHHWLKTHRGWELVEGTGRRPLVPPDHPEHPKNRRTPRATDESGAA